MKAVLFDLDDTLFAERTYVQSGFGAVAAFLAPRLGRPESELSTRLSELHDRDGRGRLFETLLAESGAQHTDRTLVLACLATYRAHEPRLEPLPDVVPTLRRLEVAGFALGLVSDGLASVQRRKLAALPEISAMLDAVVLTSELGPEYAKPSPASFRVACELLEVAPSEASYVGNDVRKDFTGARAAGLTTIRVGQPPDERGARIEPAIASEADVVLDRFASLTAALLVERVEMR